MHVTYTQDQSVPWYIYQGMKRLGSVYSVFLPRSSLSLLSSFSLRLPHFSRSLTVLISSPVSPPLTSPHGSRHRPLWPTHQRYSGFLVSESQRSTELTPCHRHRLLRLTLNGRTLSLSLTASLSLSRSLTVYIWVRETIYSHSHDLLWYLLFFSRSTLNSHSQILWPCGWLPDWVRV